MPPLRMIAFLGIYGVLLLAAFAFPAAGVWGFLFESNYHPPYNPWWGSALASIGDRWSFYIGAVMCLATLLHWGRNNVKVFSHPTTIWLVLFTCNAFLVTLWAFDVQASWKESVDKLKWLAAYVCIIKAHGDRRWLSVVVFIYLFAAIDAGWQTTFDPKGGRAVRGGPMSTGDENFVSAHMVALLPLLACYVVSPQTPSWIRAFFILGAPLMLNVVAHARSRGAFLALIAAAAVMPLLSKGRLRTWTVVALAVGALLSARLFAENFWERMSTITEESGTGSGRTVAWADAWQLSLRNPIGWGGEAFDRGLKSNEHIPSTHNMYLECLVAWGFQGTFFWLMFIGSTMWECRKLMREAYQPGHWPQSREFFDSFGVLVGMVSMVVAAVFLNRMRWELWWVFAAYVMCLKNLSPVSREADAGWEYRDHSVWRGVDVSRRVRSAAQVEV